MCAAQVRAGDCSSPAPAEGSTSNEPRPRPTAVAGCGRSGPHRLARAGPATVLRCNPGIRHRSQNAACTKLGTLRSFSSRRPALCFTNRTTRISQMLSPFQLNAGWRCRQKWSHRTDSAVANIASYRTSQSSFVVTAALAMTYNDPEPEKKNGPQHCVGARPCVFLFLPHQHPTPYPESHRTARWAGCLSRMGRQQGGGFMAVRAPRVPVPCRNSATPGISQWPD